MPILPIIIGLVVVGVILYCINAFVPMDSKVKKILNIVVILALVAWLLQEFGLFDYLGGVNVPRAHHY